MYTELKVYPACTLQWRARVKHVSELKSKKIFEQYSIDVDL